VSEKGRFNAAITILELEEAKLNRGLGHPQISDEIKRNLTPMLFDYRAAIRVLEAAGRVDIRSAQFFIDGAANFGEGLSVINSDSSRCLYQTGEKQIRALLESLPDKEE